MTTALGSSNSAPISSRQLHPHLTWQARIGRQLEAPARAKLGVRMIENDLRGTLRNFGLKVGNGGDGQA
jgi:hypothetical protein